MKINREKPCLFFIWFHEFRLPISPYKVYWSINAEAKNTGLSSSMREQSSDCRNRDELKMYFRSENGMLK